jgi:hypothetical protein
VDGEGAAAIVIPASNTITLDSVNDVDALFDVSTSPAESTSAAIATTPPAVDDPKVPTPAIPPLPFSWMCDQVGCGHINGGADRRCTNCNLAFQGCATWYCTDCQHVSPGTATTCGGCSVPRPVTRPCWKCNNTNGVFTRSCSSCHALPWADPALMKRLPGKFVWHCAACSVIQKADVSHVGDIDPALLTPAKVGQLSCASCLRVRGALSYWNCHKCGTDNRLQKRSCRKCNSPLRMKKNAGDASAGNAEWAVKRKVGSDAKKTEWVCGICRRVNAGAVASCGACGGRDRMSEKDGAVIIAKQRSDSDTSGQKKKKNRKRAQRSSASKAVAAETAAGTWSCGLCSSRNDSDVQFCERCMDPRPTTTVAPDSDSRVKNVTKSQSQHDGGGAPPKREDWLCGKCKFTNFSRRTVCLRCGGAKGATSSPASTVDGKKQPSTEAAKTVVVGPPPWACGCGTDNASAAATCIDCGAVRPAATVWVCGTCSCENQAPFSTCAACETERPAARSSSPAVAGARRKEAHTSYDHSRWKCHSCFAINAIPDGSSAAVAPSSKKECTSCGLKAADADHLIWFCKNESCSFKTNHLVSPQEGLDPIPVDGLQTPVASLSAWNHGHRRFCFVCNRERTPKTMPLVAYFWQCATCLSTANRITDPVCVTCRRGNLRTPGDWICGDCGHTSFAKREVCFHCSAPKPATYIHVTPGQPATRTTKGVPETAVLTVDPFAPHFHRNDAAPPAFASSLEPEAAAMELTPAVASSRCDHNDIGEPLENDGAMETASGSEVDDTADACYDSASDADADAQGDGGSPVATAAADDWACSLCGSGNTEELTSCGTCGVPKL